MKRVAQMILALFLVAGCGNQPAYEEPLPSPDQRDFDTQEAVFIDEYEDPLGPEPDHWHPDFPHPDQQQEVLDEAYVEIEARGGRLHFITESGLLVSLLWSKQPTLIFREFSQQIKRFGDHRGYASPPVTVMEDGSVLNEEEFMFQWSSSAEDYFVGLYACAYVDEETVRCWNGRSWDGAEQDYTPPIKGEIFPTFQEPWITNEEKTFFFLKDVGGWSELDRRARLVRSGLMRPEYRTGFFMQPHIQTIPPLCFVDADRNAVFCGSLYSLLPPEQLDHAPWIEITTEEGEPLRDIVEMEIGQDHGCAMNASGKVFCWGNNEHGELGDDTTESRLWAKEVLFPEEDEAPVQIDAGTVSSCALFAPNRIYCWGEHYGEVPIFVDIDLEQLEVDWKKIEIE